MFFDGFSGFGGFSAIPVAVSRHALSGSGDTWRWRLAAARPLLQAAVRRPLATLRNDPARPWCTARAEARWDAVIKDDLDAAYAYMSPASREVTSLEKYKANTAARRFREAKIDSVACEADACTVRLLVTYDHPRMKGITTPIVESWIIDGGQAWYVYG